MNDGVNSDVLAERVKAGGVDFETGDFTFSDEGNNRTDIRLGYSTMEGP